MPCFTTYTLRVVPWKVDSKLSLATVLILVISIAFRLTNRDGCLEVSGSRVGDNWWILLFPSDSFILDNLIFRRSKTQSQ